jgi:hypothetical protein
MKIGLALPHLGPDATKVNIIKLAVDAEKEGSLAFETTNTICCDS